MAATRVVMQIEGLEDLQWKLDTLSKSEEKWVFRSALRESQKLMQKSAKNEATSTVGGTMGKAIKDHIILRGFKKRRKYSVGFNVMSDPAWVDQSTPGTTDDPRAPIYITKSTGRRQYIPAAIEYGHVVAFKKGISKTGRKMRGWLHGKGLPSGSSWVAPMPYMRRASDMSQDGRFRIFREQLDRFIKRIWGKKDYRAAQADLARYAAENRTTFEEF